MKGLRGLCLLAGVVLSVGSAMGQALAAVANQADAGVEAAEALIGRALFLRGFYKTDDLSYDPLGRVEGAPKTDDWTLAGIDVKKVERRGPKGIYLEGQRVAIRYNTDNHQFERHPLKDEVVKVTIADPGTVQGLEAALNAVFSQGIDLKMQQSTPAYWQHYFNPGLAYPQDALIGQQVYPMTASTIGGPPMTPPQVVHKVDAKMPDAAEKDRVQGTVQMRLVVDAAGVPQRVSIARPLGYGLDERAVESVSKWRFTPATREGAPVAVVLVVNYDFKFVVPPRP